MRRLSHSLLAAATLGLAAPAMAHDRGAAHGEGPGWTLDPWILAFENQDAMPVLGQDCS